MRTFKVKTESKIESKSVWFSKAASHVAWAQGLEVFLVGFLRTRCTGAFPVVRCLGSTCPVLWARVGPWPGTESHMRPLRVHRSGRRSCVPRVRPSAVKINKQAFKSPVPTALHVLPQFLMLLRLPLGFLLAFGVLTYLVSKQQQQLTFT